MCKRPLTYHINIITQEEMECVRCDPPTRFQYHMREFHLQSTRNRPQFGWLEIVKHNYVCTCSRCFGSLLVAAGFNLKIAEENPSFTQVRGLGHQQGITPKESATDGQTREIMYS